MGYQNLDNPESWLSARTKINANTLDLYTGSFASVRWFGTVGDGVTDDTVAIKSAYDYALENGLSLVFPSGTYLVSRSLYIHSNAHLVGLPGAIIKKIPAQTQAVVGAISENDTVIPVVDASVFAVDQDCMIGVSTTDGYANTVGVITEVNEINDTIKISAYKSTGMAFDYADGAAVVSTTFSMVTTNRTSGDAHNIIIDGLSFDGNPQVDEPVCYMLASIHIDPTNSSNITIKNNTVLESAADGISDQSTGNSIITNNRIANCGVHGIHVGYTINRVLLEGNSIEDCVVSGIYWCYEVHEITVQNNFIKGCGKGCNGIDGTSFDSIISGNVFIANDIDINISATSGGLLVANNTFNNTSGDSIFMYASQYVNVVNNIFSGGGGVGVMVHGSKSVNVSNNQFIGWLGTYALVARKSVNELHACNNVRFSGNVTRGCSAASIDILSADHIIVSENDCETSATYNLTIDADTDSVKVLGNWFDKGINSLGTNVIQDNN